jgi:phosphatidylglycerol---prolipoprotein diacylglyceryl transferase
MAVIQLDFDPLLRLGEFGLRWQTVGIALALLLGVAMAARGRVQPAGPRPPRPSRGRPRYPPAPRITASGEVVEALPLRLDDMGYILLASVPGAVIGGRLVHGLAFWDAYSIAPERLLDPTLGSLSLLGAVLGGVVSGAYMTRLLSAPVRRWADAATVPLLTAMGLGKLAQFLGGSGQGAPFGGPWAVAFVGDGPWVSASPELPAHPAQVYEGIWLLLAALLVMSLASSVRGHPSRAGVLFVAGLTSFLLGRVVIGFTWRDEPLLGPLNAEQSLALAALLMLLATVLGTLAAGARRGDVEIVRDGGRQRSR